MSATREMTRATQAAEPSEALYAKLSPGPGMSAREVASHQRGRIHGAMIEIAGESGYGAVTVRELANLAGVSTRAFYQHFRDKAECFYSTYDLVVQRAIRRIVIAQDGEHDWRERMGRAFAAYSREVAGKPRAARLALVEPFEVGPTAVEQLRRTDALCEAMIGESLAGAPESVELPPLVLKGMVGGVARVTRARLLDGRTAEMPGLGESLTRWALGFHDAAAANLVELDRRRLPSTGIADSLSTNGARQGQRVAEDERSLILAAVAKLSVAEGLERLTIPKIRSAAGISRRIFNTHFESVRECVLSTLEARALDAIDSSAGNARGEDWIADAYASLSAFCMRIACDPMLSRPVFSEQPIAGYEGLRRQERIVDALPGLFTRGAPDDVHPDSLDAEAAAGAVWCVLRHHVVAGRAQDLPRIAATLTFLALAPTVGPLTATDAIRRAQEGR